MLGDEVGPVYPARDIVTSLDEIIGNDRTWSDDDDANDLEVRENYIRLRAQIIENVFARGF